ncbi:MAG TPA: serine hydrolase domain-containing protein [Bryobacteraceae bacterium]|nr:serine hydrolase domain-containing protein [Bryobacteraceae bacterium]
MLRRAFLQSALAPLLTSTWRASAPPASITELQTIMRESRVPGAVIGAVHDHKLAWIAPLGVLEAGKSEAVDKDTIFHAASLSKQLTAHAAFALRSQGKLDFDRPLVEYVDDLRHPQARLVTARQVLSHSSGLPNWRYADGYRPAPELAPAFAPGSRYKYSGEGYFYLQRVMERVSNTGFEQLMQELVIKPLGMSSTTFIWDPQTTARTAKAHGKRGEIGREGDRAAAALRRYAAASNKPVAALKYEEYSRAFSGDDTPVLPNGLRPNAAASLVTSASDYAQFLSAALRNAELGKQQFNINESLAWGLGWAIERASGKMYLFQWGDNPGFKNFVLAEPSTGSAIFVFTNGDAGRRVYEHVIIKATGHDHPAFAWL